jgi:serine/threonine-protein kinase
MEREVAIKVLLPRFAANKLYRKAFLTSARMQAKTAHPNVVQGIDIGERGNLVYVVMEYIGGPKLSTVLERGGKLAPGRAVAIALQIAQALQAAHAHGLVHRDVRPHNVMIDPEGVAKLRNFGHPARIKYYLERSLEESPTWDSMAFYISPELIRNSHLADPRGDIYSLGATLYHMLVGSPPFVAGTVRELLRKHREEPLVALRKAQADVPTVILQVVEKMMRRTVSLRYQRMEEVIQELETARSALSEKALPVPPPIRPRRRLSSRALRARRRMRRRR